MLLTPETLVGRAVRLVPLDTSHDAELKAACDADQDIWTLYPIRMNADAYEGWRRGVDARVHAGAALAYAIMLEGRVVGVSLFTLDAPNLRVEIGNTYLHPEVRGGIVNPDAKRAMMDHAFESGANCVQYRVDALNKRSCNAVLKLGARRDGILRADRITWTGRVRDTVVFSILAQEWPSARAALDDRLAAFTFAKRDNN